MANIYHGLAVETDEDRLKKQEFDFLDSIDIENYVKNPDWSVLRMMDEIQEDHGKEYTKESYIFNAIDMEDFMSYIKRRFKGKYDFYVYSEYRTKLGSDYRKV